MASDRERLLTVVRMQADAKLPWERAETCLLEQELRDRLQRVGVQPTPDVAAALMSVAMLLAECAPEWGGDARDALAQVAALGLALLDDGGVADPDHA